MSDPAARPEADGSDAPFEDARFEDAPFADKPLRLKAESVEDLAVVSALCQDAVTRARDVKWLPTKRRLVILANRFRWEDAEAAHAEHRTFERVRAALSIEDVRRVRARGVDAGNPEAVISILAVTFAPAGVGEDEAGGTLTITCAGEAAFLAEVEVLDARLADLTRPWTASAGAPRHDEAD